MEKIKKILYENNKNFLNFYLFNLLTIITYYILVDFVFLKITNLLFSIVFNIILITIYTIFVMYYMSRKYFKSKIYLEKVLKLIMMKIFLNFFVIFFKLIYLKLILDILLFYFDYLYIIKNFNFRNSLKYSFSIIKVVFLKLISVLFIYIILISILVTIFISIFYTTEQINNQKFFFDILNYFNKLSSIAIIMQASTTIEVYQIYFSNEVKLNG